MKATDMLKQQHRKVESIFKKLEGDDASEELVRELAANLTSHMAIEQDVFYPAVRAVDEDLVGEAFEEHAVAEFALKRLLATDVDDKTFKSRVTTLKELIEHHVKEEEHELFPAVEKAMAAKDLTALASEMKPRFEEALLTGPEALLPRQGLTTTADIAQDSDLTGAEDEPASPKRTVTSKAKKTAAAKSDANQAAKHSTRAHS